MRASTKLRKLIEGDDIVVAPGCYDGLSARLVESAGFPAVYVSGGAMARSTGIPDMGLISLSEIAQRLGQIVDAIGIPAIADMDTGYGNALNARQAIRAFERAGVAGFHLEDQTFPKRCGHYDDKSLVPTEELCQKIRAIKDASEDPDMVLIARTDAIAVEGFDAAIDRMHAYMEAGADVAFVEAPTTEEEIEAVAERIPGPKLINMFLGAKTPLLSVQRLKEIGYKIVIIPSDAQRAAIKAMQKALEMIQKDGHSGAMADEMASFQDREAIVNTARFIEVDQRYAS
ncbi:MAG: isocitrate lyase [Alphaproteobacteria bacterium]|nr:isocitrate lyase [Alphaproteobacteria bacterium]